MPGPLSVKQQVLDDWVEKVGKKAAGCWMTFMAIALVIVVTLGIILLFRAVF